VVEVMNIAMLSYHTCPLATLGGKDTGGMNVYVRDLTRYLGRIGIHVDVFTRSQDEHVPHVLHDLGYGNRVVHVPAGPEHPLSKEEMVRYIPDFVQGIREFAEAKHLRYDVIHSHYWMSGMAGSELKRVWNVPMMHMFHTLVRMKNRIARSEAEIEGGYRLEGEQSVLNAADRIVVATPAEQSQLEFLYLADSRKLVTIPPGVDSSRFYPIPMDEAKAVIGISPDEHMILFVGRIEPLKGVDTLVRAIALLKKTGRLDCCPHYLAIVGGDPEASSETMNAEMARLQGLVSELGIHDLVVFLGKRGQDSLPYYYSAAEMVVMPSHYESFGMVALEAMACGTPVVASQVGGLAFLVQDGVTGYVVPGGEVEPLAARLLEIATQPGLRDQLGRQGSEYARLFAWDIIARRIAEVYGELVAQPA
jgi:D-inositol-3-phosphate glycosyltransferase